jgi:hypothetical protein
VICRYEFERLFLLAVIHALAEVLDRVARGERGDDVQAAAREILDAAHARWRDDLNEGVMHVLADAGDEIRGEVDEEEES